MCFDRANGAFGLMVAASGQIFEQKMAAPPGFVCLGMQILYDK
jgi:hypothetical protein